MNHDRNEKNAGGVLLRRVETLFLRLVILSFWVIDVFGSFEDLLDDDW